MALDDQFRRFLIEGERAGTRYALKIPQDAMHRSVGYVTGHSSGSSVDFKDYREYQPGDDLRAVDWSVFARTDKLIVKMFRDEVDPHLDVILDCSASMDLPDSEKARAAVGLTSLLAVAASNARCSHVGWMISNGFQQIENSRDLPSFWRGIAFDGDQSPSEAYSVMPGRWRRGGIRILISDLLWPGDPLTILRPLADGASALAVIQLLAEADVDPGIRGSTRLYDVETSQSLEVFVDAVAEQQYKDALSRHQQSWSRACRQIGASMATVVGERIVGDWRLHSLEDAQIVGAA